MIMGGYSHDIQWAPQFFFKNKEAGRLYKKFKVHKSTSMGIMIFVKLYVHPWAL